MVLRFRKRDRTRLTREEYEYVPPALPMDFNALPIVLSVVAPTTIGMRSDLMMQVGAPTLSVGQEVFGRSLSGCQMYQERQQRPYRSQSRNHGLCASISSCLRFAAARSSGLSGLASGAAKMRSRHSI